MPKVSIIIPVYNAEKYLPRALDSIVGQPFADLEVICVNDGSKDSSLQILRKYEKSNKQIKVINQDNNGGSAARNTGLRHATGQYVMFLDSDDVYAADIVGRAYDRAIKTGADVVLYNFARFVGRPSRLAVKSKITPGNDIDFFTKESHADRFFNDFATITWNKLIKRSILVDNNLRFDTGLSHNHDVDFSIRLMLAAESYSWLEEIGYYYRANENGITATKRNDPTNVLKILINLNDLVASRGQELKRSFDNYVVDMVVGTLVKYGDTPSKQKEVFDFAHDVVIPSLDLDKRGDDYLFTQLADAYSFVEAGDYGGYVAYFNKPKRKLRAKLRRIYDTGQAILSHFIV